MTKFSPELMVKTLDKYPLSNEGLTFLLYGPTKSGKTHIAGTFGSRSYYINIGNGFSTLLAPKFKSIYAKLYNNEPYNPIRVDLSGDDLYTQVVEATDYALDKIPEQWDTFVLDDASRLQDASMDKAIDVNYDTGKSKSRDVERATKVRVVGVQDFGTQMGIVDNYFSQLTDACKSMGKNLVVLAHEKRSYKTDKMVQILTDVEPLFTGNNKITSYFDMVWNTSFIGAGEQVSYRARTSRTEIIEAGTRWGGVFPENFKDPNYPEILRLLGRK